MIIAKKDKTHTIELNGRKIVIKRLIVLNI